MAFVNRLVGKQCIRALALANRGVVAPKVSPSVVQSRASHDDHGHHEDYIWAKMDEFPMPTGSWQEAHEKQQSKYNMQLAMSLGFAGAVAAYYLLVKPVDWGLAPPMTNKDLSFWYDNEKK